MSNQGFSLFPSTVPKISIPDPHRKNPSLHSISLVASPESTTLSANGESILIKMEEEQPPLPRFPRDYHPQQRRYSTPSPEDIGRAVTTSSPIDGRTPTHPVPPSGLNNGSYTPSLYQSPNPIAPSPRPSFSLGAGSALTLVQIPPPPPAAATPSRRTVEPSPIVPIRSMFPTYDPSVPLTKQPYAPQRPLPARVSGLSPLVGFSREDYRSSLSMPFNTAVPRTAPPSLLNFPSDVMSVNVGPRISTQRELEKLWEASHGTEPDSAIKIFDLEMARTEEATFVFGSHPSLPFYTLQTYDTNEIAISKTCPRKATSTRDVVLCPLEPPARRQPPNDGLVAFIFPKLAAMLAINQSASLAREHSLAPTDRDDIEAEAVRRAAKQEACHLRFNAEAGVYELEHPAIGRGAVAGDFALKSPAITPGSPTTTVLSPKGKPVLHIMITTDSPLPTIVVFDPNAPTFPSIRRRGTMMSTVSAGQGIRRLSTIPQAETVGLSALSETPPLASLDLTSQLLHLDANAILELMPSLFSIDSVVSAILAVAVADASTNAVLGSMETWRPRPAPASRLGLGGSGLGDTRSLRAGSIKSYAGSAFYATIAEREEAEEEAKLMRKTHENDVRGGGAKSPGGGNKSSSRTWFGWKKAFDAEDRDEKKGGKNKTKKVVVTEFDLEKLGHYQSGERKGEELPVVTRSALSGLVVGLKLLVWALTMIVQVLAWLLVNISRAVTSEKF